MKFELGKFYKHSTGRRVYIAGVMESMFYGRSFIGEDEYGRFSPVGSEEDNAVNFVEITKEKFLSPSETLSPMDICLTEEDYEIPDEVKANIKNGVYYNAAKKRANEGLQSLKQIIEPKKENKINGN